MINERGQIDADQIQSLLGLEVPVIIWHETWQGIPRPRIAGYDMLLTATQLQLRRHPRWLPAFACGKRRTTQSRAEES